MRDEMLVCVQDDVRPISCRGHDSQGGVAITLIDALDTLLVRSCQSSRASLVPVTAINN